MKKHEKSTKSKLDVFLMTGWFQRREEEVGGQCLECKVAKGSDHGHSAYMHCKGIFSSGQSDDKIYERGHSLELSEVV